MAMMRRLAVFRDEHPLIGPVFWMLSVQYYLTQYLVGRQFTPSFSLLHNTISDLGNTYCGGYGVRQVCSPQHNYMNASFLILGLAMIIGSWFIQSEFRNSRLAKIGFWLMAAAGFGTILVGLFPENTVAMFHITGAALAFVFGNIALIIFSFSLKLPPVFRWVTRLLGVFALVALVLFMTKTYLGLDIGGMERIVAYPQSIWLIMFGVYMSMNHYRTRRGSKQRYS